VLKAQAPLKITGRGLYAHKLLLSRNPPVSLSSDGQYEADRAQKDQKDTSDERLRRKFPNGLPSACASSSFGWDKKSFTEEAYCLRLLSFEELAKKPQRKQKATFFNTVVLYNGLDRAESPSWLNNERLRNLDLDHSPALRIMCSSWPFLAPSLPTSSLKSGGGPVGSWKNRLLKLARGNKGLTFRSRALGRRCKQIQAETSKAETTDNVFKAAKDPRTLCLNRPFPQRSQSYNIQQPRNHDQVVRAKPPLLDATRRTSNDH